MKKIVYTLLVIGKMPAEDGNAGQGNYMHSQYTYIHYIAKGIHLMSLRCPTF